MHRSDVLGLTTVGGNASLASTTRNALCLLHYLGREDVPVFRGAASPLEGKFRYLPYYHGRGGLPVRLPTSELLCMGQLRGYHSLIVSRRTGPCICKGWRSGN